MKRLGPIVPKTPPLKVTGLLILSLSLLAASCDETEPPAASLAVEAAEAAKEEVVEVVTPPVRPVVHKRPLAEGATLETLQGIGLMRPVAALYDPTADVYLVSNAGRDGHHGFISSLLPDGELESLRWIDGDKGALRSPHGMALMVNRIVVADGEHLLVFDRETGAPRGAIRVPGAIALKDIAVGNRGDIFVTDTGFDGKRRAPFGGVYRMNRRGVVSVVSKSSVLGRPTGLFTVGSTVWISADEPSSFYGIARDGRLEHGVAPPAITGVSWLTRSGDQVFFSSPEARTVYRGPIQGPFEPVVMAVDSPGDVGWDAARHRLLVPRADDDALELHTLPAEAP